MPVFCDPHFLVHGQNHIRSFLYMDRILQFVHIRGNKDTILFIYGNRDFITRLSTKINICLTIAKYKEVSAIKKVLYKEVLPCDEFIIQQFSINQTYVRYFIETRLCLTFVFR